MAVKAGRCLLQLRLAEAGLTQQDIVDRLNMTRSQVSDYAHNRRLMGLETAVSIAGVIGCRVEELYEWIPIPPSVRKRSKRTKG